MNRPRKTKISRLLNRLKNAVSPEAGTVVRRRNLLSSRQGDVQLELDFDHPETVTGVPKWLDMTMPEARLAS